MKSHTVRNFQLLRYAIIHFLFAIHHCSCVQGGRTKFPHWFEPLLLWPQRLHKFNTICIRYLHPQTKYRCTKTYDQPSHLRKNQFLVKGVKKWLSGPTIYFEILRLFKAITSNFDLKPLSYNLFHQARTVFAAEIICNSTQLLPNKWVYFKIYLWHQEAIEVIKVNLAAN